ncbi:Metacaspase-1 [Diplonema papillatum]|nr:Metacaspase-1 [Diplonema papillatum]KAJ9443087.1 Metacaspase-1 [Diplonema papillatum]KAJ9457398.1 Metacaspase-1 [Diplonema papillatum]|eukprot:gene774-1188_t
MGICSSKPAPSATGGSTANPGKPTQPASAATAKPTQSNAPSASATATGDIANTAEQACPADVYMFSGCKDAQTSADVSDVMSFGVPGPGGAGGACTNALLVHCYKPDEATWVTVLSDMVRYLEDHGYTQRPMLSTSRKTDLSGPFSIAGTQTGAKKALLIGINYTSHTQGRLSGCINDVASMKRYIETQGFGAGNMTFLVDGDHEELPSHKQPTKKNIEDSIDEFVAGARAGDSLFFHYSGHGGQQKDTSGDEKDSKDETLIPEDYQTAGVISDDELFQRLCSKLPKGVRLVCIMDCCHSGTILDLPYSFEATKEGLEQVQSSGGFTSPNDSFLPTLQKLFKKVGPMLSEQSPQLGALAKQFGIF